MGICQLMETTLLTLINYASLVATNAARHVIAAAGKVGREKEKASTKRQEYPNTYNNSEYTRIWAAASPGSGWRTVCKQIRVHGRVRWHEQRACKQIV
jgi:hypothetical protein